MDHKHIQWKRKVLSTIVLTALTAFSCSESDGPLAPYAGGGGTLSTLTVEQNSFRPELTWVGGYASMVGINKGTVAVLDSSLIW